MNAARLSPTANLLRKSRLFALPPTLSPPSDAATSRSVSESDSATLPHPIRAAIETPDSSLARGDWGLKRPLPAKSTSQKSTRPVVRVNALDTYEHVTDFDSAADHTITLEKFQELNLPISLPSRPDYSTAFARISHRSPFEAQVDNTENSAELKTVGARQFRHSGPWLAGQSELEFERYLKDIRRKKPELLQKLRELYVAKRNAERRTMRLESTTVHTANTVDTVSDEDFTRYIKSLRADPRAMGKALYEILDLPSPPLVPSERISSAYFESPGTKLSSAEYAVSGPPRTHPSAGLSYSRTASFLYNHPLYGAQASQKPVEARVLLPRKRFRGRASKAIVGIGGIATEDIGAGSTFYDPDAPQGLGFYDSTIPGGAKYWVSPLRTSIDAAGKISLVHTRAKPSTRIAYGVSDYKTPTPTRILDIARGGIRRVPHLDRASSRQSNFNTDSEPLPVNPPLESRDDITRSLLKTLRPS